MDGAAPVQCSGKLAVRVADVWIDSSVCARAMCVWLQGGVDEASGACYWYSSVKGSQWEAPDCWTGKFGTVTSLSVAGQSIGTAGASKLAHVVSLFLPGMHLKSIYFDGNGAINDDVALALVEAVTSAACVLEVLSLKECGFGDEGAAQVARCICDSHKLRALHLDRQKGRLGDSGAREIAAACAKSSRFEVIGLSGNKGISDDGAARFANALDSADCGLKELYFSGTKIGDAGASELARVMRKGGCNLRTLSMSGCRIGDTGALALAAALKTVAKARMPLQGLDLQGNTFGADAKKQLVASAPRSCFLVVEEADGSYKTNR